MILAQELPRHVLWIKIREREKECMGGVLSREIFNVHSHANMGMGMIVLIGNAVCNSGLFSCV